MSDFQSQYMLMFRAPEAERILSENNYRVSHEQPELVNSLIRDFLF